jgi:hypothetical protein
MGDPTLHAISRQQAIVEDMALDPPAVPGTLE